MTAKKTTRSRIGESRNVTSEAVRENEAGCFKAHLSAFGGALQLTYDTETASAWPAVWFRLSSRDQLHPVVAPHELHFKQDPFLTIV